jgi:hypothetical protein
MTHRGRIRPRLTTTIEPCRDQGSGTRPIRDGASPNSMSATPSGRAPTASAWLRDSHAPRAHHGVGRQPQQRCHPRDAHVSGVQRRRDRTTPKEKGVDEKSLVRLPVPDQRNSLRILPRAPSTPSTAPSPSNPSQPRVLRCRRARFVHVPFRDGIQTAGLKTEHLIIQRETGDAPGREPRCRRVDDEADRL